MSGYKFDPYKNTPISQYQFRTPKVEPHSRSVSPMANLVLSRSEISWSKIEMSDHNVSQQFLEVPDFGNGINCSPEPLVPKEFLKKAFSRTSRSLKKILTKKRSHLQDSFKGFHSPSEYRHIQKFQKLQKLGDLQGRNGNLSKSQGDSRLWGREKKFLRGSKGVKLEVEMPSVRFVKDKTSKRSKSTFSMDKKRKGNSFTKVPIRSHNFKHKIKLLRNKLKIHKITILPDKKVHYKSKRNIYLSSRKNVKKTQKNKTLKSLLNKSDVAENLSSKFMIWNTQVTSSNSQFMTKLGQPQKTQKSQKCEKHENLTSLRKSQKGESLQNPKITKISKISKNTKNSKNDQKAYLSYIIFT